MNHQLLPVANDAPSCSDFARSIDANPVGSGLSLNRVILVSVPLPWPKPALGHPALKPAAALIAHSTVASRLFAAQPWSATGDDQTPTAAIEIYDRMGADVMVSEATTQVEGIASTLAEIAATPLGQTAAARQLEQPTFLVCTQGTHDRCCGTYGTALADELERSRPNYTLRRVSHTGGHRFAPTLIALPQARMWAHVDMPLVDRIAANAVTAQDLSTKCRGALSAAVGPAQVAENAVRCLSTGWFEHEISVRVEEHEPGFYRCTVTVGSDTDRWYVEVSVAREIPTIACESPGGLPAKTGHDYRWSEPRRLGHQDNGPLQNGTA